jgi:glycosyltransferase involved in cell wall biosynthesis
LETQLYKFNKGFFFDSTNNISNYFGGVRVNIGIFTNCYLPLVNGVVGAIGLLRKGFIEQGHQVYVFAPGYDDYRDQEENVFRYPAVDLTRKVKFPVAIPFSPRINQTLHSIPLDVIHSHHPFVLGPAALSVARRKRIPVVYTFHTQYDQYSHYIPLPGVLVREVAKYQVKRYCHAVDRITTPSGSAQRILGSYGIDGPVRVIPNPTDLSSFLNRDGSVIRRKYGIGDAKLLMNIGRVAPEKNLSFLLTAFQYILKSSPSHDSSEPDIWLLIAGEGPDLSNLKHQAEALGIAGRVIFTGLVDRAEIPTYLAAADLFVMSSTTEVKPLAQLEALAAGVPIVAVSAPGADDTIIHDENGLLAPQTITEFGDAIRQLLFDSERLRRYQAAAIKTAANYSHPKIATDYLELYRDMIRSVKS